MQILKTPAPSKRDPHTYTLQYNKMFWDFMVMLHGVEWRRCVSPADQRNAAKAWNHGIVLGAENRAIERQAPRLIKKNA